MPITKNSYFKSAGLVAFAVALLIGILAAAGFGQDPGRKVFETKCFSCHNIGGGNKQGPDLKGVTDRRSEEWLKEFIRTPTAMSRKDQDAASLFKDFAPEIMPDQSLTDEEMDSLLKTIKTLSDSGEMFTPEGAKLARPIRRSDVREGWRLFTGQKEFENGGVACSTCHGIGSFGSYGGGTLGPDLTATNIKYRDPELILILQEPNFPTMTEMFRDHKLTEEEIVQVFAYLKHSKEVSPNAAIAATTDSGAVEPRFLITGFVFTVLALVGLNFVWRKRHGNVRGDIVERSKI
ncbi:MAG: c-type cytochrome [Pyrinomonadaceae bacterium]|nr:c-type cytochrome [Pyrinomonadaceae bacterium]